MYDWLTIVRACQIHHNRTEDQDPMPQKPDPVVELLDRATKAILAGEDLLSLAVSAQAIVIVLTRINAELVTMGELYEATNGAPM